MKPEFSSTPFKNLIGILKSNIGSIIILNLLLALVAFIKDISVAAYFGTSRQADALFTAYFLPDMLGNNLMASAAAVACVPVFSRLYAGERPEKLNQCLLQTGIFGFAIFMVLFSALFAYKQVLIGTLANGFDQETIEVCLRIFMILMPIFLSCFIIAVGIPALQASGHIKITALVPVVFNTVFLSGVLLAVFANTPVTNGVYTVAISITAGNISMAAIVLVMLCKTGLLRLGMRKLVLAVNIKNEACENLKNIGATFLYYLLILASTQAVLYVERFLASGFGPGGVASLNYAYRLAQFPVWVYVAAISVVILPSLSRYNMNGEAEQIKASQEKALLAVLTVSIPITILFFFLRKPIIYLLFCRGAFSLDSVEITAGIFGGYSLTIVGQSISVICLRFYIAAGRMRLPLLISLVSSSANIVIDLLLVQRIGIGGLGYGAAFGFAFNAFMMLCFLNIEIKSDLLNQWPNFKKILLLNIPIAAISLLSDRLWHILPSGTAPLSQWMFIITVLGSCALVYFLGTCRSEILKIIVKL